MLAAVQARVEALTEDPTLTVVDLPALAANFAIDMRNRAQASVVVIEAIKLLESGLARECDAVWAVHVPEAMQEERLMSKRGLKSTERAAILVQVEYERYVSRYRLDRKLRRVPRDGGDPAFGERFTNDIHRAPSSSPTVRA